MTAGTASRPDHRCRGPHGAKRHRAGTWPGEVTLAVTWLIVSKEKTHPAEGGFLRLDESDTVSLWQKHCIFGV